MDWYFAWVIANATEIECNLLWIIFFFFDFNWLMENLCGICSTEICELGFGLCFFFHFSVGSLLFGIWYTQGLDTVYEMRGLLS